MEASYPTVKRIVGPTILLRSGTYFDFEAPETSAFTIKDIAHALSHICRFGGHCPTFYSVAQHSVLASYAAPEGFEFEALMHDAHEAFVGDMVKPLKILLPAYAEIEDRIERAVRSRFGLPLEMSPEVKQVDLGMLASEQRSLLNNSDHWQLTRGVEAFRFRIVPWDPVIAKYAFLDRFNQLTKGAA